jgi:glycosyltransferase involved in cell wall biosynthesis
MNDDSRVTNGPSSILLHYWLVSFRGGERVLKEIHSVIKPKCAYSHLIDKNVVEKTGLTCEVKESAFARLPFARRLYKILFPFMYIASYMIPTSHAELIVSSESGSIKGVRKKAGSVHVCYCHSPFRILWAPWEWYRPRLGAYARMLPIFRWPLRIIDKLTARSVDLFIANSSYIQKRIMRAYGRNSIVIYPPVDVERFEPVDKKGNYFLWLGELVSYKRPDLVVEAFNRNQIPLKVIGRGEMLDKLKSEAASNIEFLERVSDEELPALLARARGLVFAGVEDFGIVFVEALASGTPVIAYKKGGVLDIVVEGETGVFFNEQTVDGLQNGIEEFTTNEAAFDPVKLSQSVQKFKPERFREEFVTAVNIELKKQGLPVVE